MTTPTRTCPKCNAPLGKGMTYTFTCGSRFPEDGGIGTYEAIGCVRRQRDALDTVVVELKGALAMFTNSKLAMDFVKEKYEGTDGLKKLLELIEKGIK